jgi:hypothetical protein
MTSELGFGQESFIKKGELTPQDKGQQKIEAHLTDRNVEPLQMEKRRDAFKDYAYLQRLKSRSLKVKENRDNLDKYEKAIQAKKGANTAYEAEFNALDDVVADFKTAVFMRQLL